MFITLQLPQFVKLPVQTPVIITNNPQSKQYETCNGSAQAITTVTDYILAATLRNRRVVIKIISPAQAPLASPSRIVPRNDYLTRNASKQHLIRGESAGRSPN